MSVRYGVDPQAWVDTAREAEAGMDKVLGALALRANETGTAHAPTSDLLNEVDVSKATLERQLSKLQKGGWVARRSVNCLALTYPHGRIEPIKVQCEAGTDKVSGHQVRLRRAVYRKHRLKVWAVDHDTLVLWIMQEARAAEDYPPTGRAGDWYGEILNHVSFYGVVVAKQIARLCGEAVSVNVPRESLARAVSRKDQTGYVSFTQRGVRVLEESGWLSVVTVGAGAGAETTYKLTTGERTYAYAWASSNVLEARYEALAG
ncbi:hypothetical protein [Nocardioides sp. NPDC006273]|uniref:hypothetical protein n=1 Tax=Nocardioides sp. NPDC006273 TaxID=3155598 RepID=UPI0033AE1474